MTAGDTYTAQVFGYTNSSTAQAYNPTVALTGYLPGSASAFTLTAAATTPTPTLTLSNATSGLGGVTYTFSNWKQSVAGTLLYLELSPNSAVFPTATSQYTVTDTPSGGTAKSITVDSAVPGTLGTGQEVVVTLATATAVNDTLNITVTGVQNPTAGGFSAALVETTAPTTAPTAGGAFSIGNSLASASLSVSPTTVAATNAVYSVSFTLPTELTVIDLAVPPEGVSVTVY